MKLITETSQRLTQRFRDWHVASLDRLPFTTLLLVTMFAIPFKVVYPEPETSLPKNFSEVKLW